MSMVQGVVLGLAIGSGIHVWMRYNNGDFSHMFDPLGSASKRDVQVRGVASTDSRSADVSQSAATKSVLPEGVGEFPMPPRSTSMNDASVTQPIQAVPRDQVQGTCTSTRDFSCVGMLQEATRVEIREEIPRRQSIIHLAQGERVICFYKGSPIDVTDFMKNHPGGMDLILKFRNKEIFHVMETHEHSRAAYRMIERLKL